MMVNWNDILVILFYIIGSKCIHDGFEYVTP